MRGNELLNKMEFIDPAYLEAAEKSPAPQRHRWFKYGLVAACLCVAVLLSYWGAPKPADAFFVKAYALEIADDGTVGLKETDLMDQSEVWFGHFDGKNFYLSVGLRYDGNNIKSVDFITEDGFFAKQYIGSLSPGNGISQTYVGPENKLVMYGEEFEIVGDRITLNDETMTDDLLLFWGTQAADMREVPEQIEIKATATFYNRRTQEVTIPIDLSRLGTGDVPWIPWVLTYDISEEDIQRNSEIKDYYMSLPLEQCELLEESIETVTDVYEVKLRGSTSWIRYFDKLEFDENGIYKSGYQGDYTADGYEVYIPVLKRDENGVYTGMIYRVPKNLQYTAE